MKTFKSILMGVTLLFVCVVTKAATGTHNYLTKDEVIDTYLNAVVHGKLSGIENAINDDAQFNIIRGENVKSLTKQQMLDAFKANENIEQDCKCTSTTVQEDDDICVRKVEMKYGDYTRTDVITALRTGSSWKITKVDTSYN